MNRKNGCKTKKTQVRCAGCAADSEVFRLSGSRFRLGGVETGSGKDSVS
jgi:hypothetical protein